MINPGTTCSLKEKKKTRLIRIEIDKGKQWIYRSEVPWTNKWNTKIKRKKKNEWSSGEVEHRGAPPIPGHILARTIPWEGAPW
jgi:hypothetical protein